MLNRRPAPVVSAEIPVPSNAAFAIRSACSTCASTRSELIDLELDRNLRAGVVAGDDALELVTPFAAEREHEELLRDGVAVRGGTTFASGRPSFSSLLIRFT